MANENANEYANFQLTLTFRNDKSISEAKRILLRWCRGFQIEGLQFKFVSEIGRNLKVHIHGYVWYSTDYQRSFIIGNLYRWNRKYGYTRESHGDIEGWVEYIRKDMDQSYNFHVSSDNYESLVSELVENLAQANAWGNYFDALDSRAVLDNHDVLDGSYDNQHRGA